RWDDAAADYARAIELMPTHPSLRHQHALVLLRKGDADGHRKACLAMLERFGQTQNPMVANSVAWACALVPDTVADAARLVTLAEKAAAARPKDHATINTLGAALYRAERFDDAVQRLDEACRLHAEGGSVWDWLFLAMAEHRLGHDGAA